MRNGQRAWCKEQRVSIADFGLWISDWMSTGRRVSIADFGLRPGGALGPYAPEGLWISDWMSRGQRVSIASRSYHISLWLGCIMCIALNLNFSFKRIIGDVDHDVLSGRGIENRKGCFGVVDVRGSNLTGVG